MKVDMQVHNCLTTVFEIMQTHWAVSRVWMEHSSTVWRTHGWGSCETAIFFLWAGFFDDEVAVIHLNLSCVHISSYDAFSAENMQHNYMEKFSMWSYPKMQPSCLLPIQNAGNNVNGTQCRIQQRQIKVRTKAMNTPIVHEQKYLPTTKRLCFEFKRLHQKQMKFLGFKSWSLHLSFVDYLFNGDCWKLN